MIKKTLHIALLFWLLAASSVATAQSGIYIPKQGKVFLASDTATLFSNLINQGNLGIAKNAVVNFSGKLWSNAVDARITDEADPANGANAQGGQVRFMGITGRQQLDGGYNAAAKDGPLFSQISISNNNGVELVNSSAKAGKEIAFTQGHVFLNSHIMVLGNGGNISGYDAAKYFVTGNSSGNGLLLREGISNADGLVTFPVGSRQGSYTPAAIRLQSGTADDFYVTVFDGVRSDVLSGGDKAAESVGKTWETGKLLRPDADAVELVLQHINSDEGDLFSRNRDRSYVSQYTGSGWDTAAQAGAPAAGSLTSGAPIASSGSNSRTFPASVSGTSYFTKFAAAAGSAEKTVLTLYGYRVNRNYASINWGTQPEVAVRRFIVQRRHSNESAFHNVDTVASKATGSISHSRLYYQIMDANNYTGVSFYRLQLVALNGDTSYSETIAVGGTPGQFNMMLWPNPTPDQFHVSVNTTLPVKSVVVWDALGQKMREEPVVNRRIITMGGLPPGAYFIGIVSPAGALLGAEKLIVVTR